LEIDGRIKIFHNKQKLEQYMTTKPLLQKILQGTLQTEKDNKTTKRQEVLNLRRTDKTQRIALIGCTHSNP
jgi:hypothetical protein